MDDSDEAWLTVRVLGVPVAIRARPQDAPRLRDQWARALSDDDPDDVEQLVDVVTSDHDDPVAHDYLLTTRVTLAALHETAGRRLNLHAGGVADADGRVLAVVAASGTGKTTAVRRLADGLGYVSDETVSIDPEPPYAVHPHAKPLSEVIDPTEPLRKRQVGADDLGLGPTPAEPRLHRLVVLQRCSPDEPGLIEVPVVDTLMAVVPQTSSLARLPDPLLTLDRVLRHAGSVVLEYAEIADHAEDLIGLMDVDVTPPGSPPTHIAGDAPEARPGAWTRTPYLDALDYGDAVVVLQETQAQRLDGPAAAVWALLAVPLTTDELVEAVQERLGPHPSAAALVEDAAGQLAGAGLLARG